MKCRIAIAALLMVPVVLVAQSAGRLKYPEAKKTAQVDDYLGTKIADPYRWLEDADSADTRAWVEAENKLTFGYLAQIADRTPIDALLTKLWNYERYGVPSKQGDWYVFMHNEGLQKQSVLYRARSLDAKPEVLLDPNEFSTDGTVAVADMTFTDDGKYMAYAIQASGSDWLEWHVREVATARDLPDVIKWSKFSSAAWKKDGSGFFYSRYDTPKEGEALRSVNKNQKLYYHAVGSSQEKDALVYERPDKPDWGLGADVTDDGRYLVIAQSEGTENKNRVFLEDLKATSPAVETFLNDFDAEYTVVGNDADRFYVKTDKGAPRSRLVAIDRRRPEPSSWTVLIPEGQGKEVLSNVTMVADRFVAIWQTDAHEQVKIYNLEGQMEREVALPGLGTVGGFSGRRAHKEGFYGYSSFTYPTTIYRYDFTAGRGEVFKKPKTPFNADAYETKQVFYASKDGTRVPMFITARKGMKLDGQNPTYLYGYGGFNIPITPSYSPAMAGWLEMGGVYAVANIRGGSEYGNAWHDAGRLQNKQNVFDDFIAAAEYLIKEKYTSTPKLAIGGASNGGLLVGACLTQRPDLFGAALPDVGVMDMLRFDKFTIGWAWTSDYGSAGTKEGFDTLIKYSPLHNIRPGTTYPPTFITTADHDDRVLPGHSLKFAATLQAAQAGDAPILIRIETKAGHGGGKSVQMQIEERADAWAFLVKVLGMKVASSK